MTKKLTANWHLRKLMALKGIFNTSDLMPLLAERGINLSRTQTFRIVTETPSYVSIDILAALCDVLDCTPNDLIEPIVQKTQVRKAVNQDAGKDPAAARKLRPVRARVKGADED
jgi:DNA-binding Xre family transcriptional regulator